MGAKVGKSSSKEDLMSVEASQRLAQSLGEASSPLFVPTRSMQQDSLSVQKMDPTISCRSARSSNNQPDATQRSYSATASATSSNRLGAFRASASQRMSRILSSTRKDMISLVRKSADRGSNNLTLDNRLSSYGMRAKVMSGDGNCQFRTLAFNLFGSQDHFRITRKAAVAHMTQHKDFFSVFFENEQEFSNYLKDMGENGTWGDELTLRAIVEAYGCEAHVITSESNNWYLVYTPECKSPNTKAVPTPPGVAAPPQGKQVFLAYVSPVHYNAIVAVRN